MWRDVDCWRMSRRMSTCFLASVAPFITRSIPSILPLSPSLLLLFLPLLFSLSLPSFQLVRVQQKQGLRSRCECFSYCVGSNEIPLLCPH
ncbi:MAG: hypothetical protein J3R72DRAFT_464230 [Linnemannia gamsii]|nr:MAG: hypothetical protein J3R72DRAFT_464230 [Linnemannia gamsii]